MEKIITIMLVVSVVTFAQQKETFIDSRDGKKYKMVKIGEQTWMAENLNYHGSDGYLGLCPGDKPRQGKRDMKSCQKFGRRYDWSEAMDINREYNEKWWGGSDEKHQGVCPSGWHLPSNAEWDVLIESVGGKETAGKHLKAKSGWNRSYNGKSGNGLDTYNFAGLPCDCVEYGTGNWWSATENNYNQTTSAYLWKMSSNTDDVDFSTDMFDTDNLKPYLFSVRCVKN